METTTVLIIIGVAFGVALFSIAWFGFCWILYKRATSPTPKQSASILAPSEGAREATEKPVPKSGLTKSDLRWLHGRFTNIEEALRIVVAGIAGEDVLQDMVAPTLDYRTNPDEDDVAFTEQLVREDPEQAYRYQSEEW
jgi:hypothetical protein